MKVMSAFFMFTLTMLLTSAAFARGPLLAERVVAGWGGPETRTRCINEWKTNGFKCSGLKCRTTTWKGCSEWATDFKQHRMIARMYGPDNISNPDKQLKEISDACLTSGLILAGVPAVAASFVNLDTEVLRTGVETCLTVQNVFSQIVAPGFEVTIDTSEYW